MWVRFVGFFNGDFEELRETISELIGSMFIDFDFDAEQMDPANDTGTISFATDDPAGEEELTFRLVWRRFNEASFSISTEWDAPGETDRLFSEVSGALADYFDDLVLLSAEQGAATSLDAYQAIHCLEAGMRQTIIWALMQRYGHNWWRDGVAGIEVHGQWGQTLGEKAQFFANRDHTIAHDRCEHHPIFYLDFSDLRTIVDNDPEIFAFLQDERERLDFAQDLTLMTRLRNRIMHALGSLIFMANFQKHSPVGCRC